VTSSVRSKPDLSGAALLLLPGMLVDLSGAALLLLPAMLVDRMFLLILFDVIL
jgi:hypothetical protein